MTIYNNMSTTIIYNNVSTIIYDITYSEVISYNLPFMFATLLYGTGLQDINQYNCCVRKMQCTAIVALFVIATLGFIFSCIQVNLGIKYDFASEFAFNSKGFLFATSSRCYKIWGAKKKIIAFPVFISIINNGPVELDHVVTEMNVIGSYTSKTFLAVNFLTNLVIPSMIAGRIWWIGHQVSKFLPTRKFNLTRQSMAVCLESGIMYPLALIPTLVLIFVNGIDLTAILIQVVGIAPTFIIVRVVLGISIENVEDTIRMNEQNGHGDQTVLSMWEANQNIDECVQKDQTAV
ncbi:hypothetical protein K435DRAFT_800395 [Dendrothele bispora CBS 962.96]|uniref:Uncharacterized protein n=1 Tax=Dendrothele bispora (strain CBS 962.96) TaxID=1314807 RepID=A0A4S8LU85_DENBC|nr:hypothetical protein K435DRAFT_800395 [Dendrothele bispora CBS 962.96]